MRRIVFPLFALLVSLGQPALAGDKQYRVVINHEEQYSIWFADREIPAGWKSTGFVGSKGKALKHIEEVWTDMRPLSNRRKIALQIYKKLQRGK